MIGRIPEAGECLPGLLGCISTSRAWACGQATPLENRTRMEKWLAAERDDHMPEWGSVSV